MLYFSVGMHSFSGIAHSQYGIRHDGNTSTFCPSFKSTVCSEKRSLKKKVKFNLAHP